MSSAAVSTTPRLDLVAIGQLAKPLVDALLSPRELTLKGERPRLEYIFQVRRELACGKKLAVQHVLAVSLADAEDTRIPLGEVLEVYRLAIALLTERRRLHGSRGELASPLELRRAIESEDRREFGENAAEREVLANENNPEALQGLLRNSARERQAQDRRDDLIRARLPQLLGERVDGDAGRTA